MLKSFQSSIKIALLATTIFYSTTLLALERINKIVIQGNQRVEISTIRNYLGLNVGDEFSYQKQNDAIKSLYSTTLFEDIDIKFYNGELKVRVQETAFISKVEFKGNSKIKSGKISKELMSVGGESLSKAKIQSDIEKIKEIYKRSGRFSILVKAEIEKQDNNRVKVIFNITEGPKTSIKRIYFVGNDNYRASELKTVILTKEARWFSFLETNDTFDPDRIEYDKELLKEFYQSVGYADFRVISSTAELADTKEYFTVTYSIEEGDKYNFGDIAIENKLPSIKDDNLSKLINIKAGQTFNMKSLEKIAETIADKLASEGYPQISVYPEVNSRNAEKLVDVKFVIDKADKVFVGKINIGGNTKTEDKVIRREFKIAEGDIFNRSHLEKGEQNLRNLNYFEKISTRIVPTNYRDRYDVEVEVEEKSTASIGFDVGYNTSGGVFGRVSFLERNFLGTGKYLNAGVQVGKKSTNYYAGITEPHFMDRDLSLGINMFRRYDGRGSGFAQADQSYSLNSVGATTSLGYEIVEDLSHDIEYTIKQDKLSAPQSSRSRFLIEQLGKYTTSMIGHTITYDQTDSRVIPKNGYLLSGSQYYAGVGGNKKFLKHEVDGKIFRSFINNKLTVKVSSSAGEIHGVGGKSVGISDRFNLGDYSLRGFSSGGIGPRDKITDEGLGGQRFYSFSTELNFPLGLPEEFNLSGALFTDVGSVWQVKSPKGSGYTKADFYNDKSPRASVGFGFIWVTRFAPIRVDWAYPIKRKRYDDTQHFHIKFATHF